jgi:hypothetical protein
MGTILKDSQGGKNHTQMRTVWNEKNSDQMVLGTVRREAGPHEREPNALKTNLTQGGSSGSRPVRPNGSPNGQAGGLVALTWIKALEGE